MTHKNEGDAGFAEWQKPALVQQEELYFAVLP